MDPMLQEKLNYFDVSIREMDIGDLSKLLQSGRDMKVDIETRIQTMQDGNNTNTKGSNTETREMVNNGNMNDNDNKMIDEMTQYDEDEFGCDETAGWDSEDETLANDWY